MSLFDTLRQEASLAGFSAFGVARVEPVDREWVGTYARWLGDGCHATMGYLENHQELRSDPAGLLPGALSMITLALNYYHAEKPLLDAEFAMYAHGEDYHETARRLTAPLVAVLSEAGYDSRVCVDTAPVRERYWALRSGIGFRGKNGMVIVPGVGSYCFLCEILTTAPLPATAPLERSCRGCDKCVRTCPGKAIMEGGLIDARRCASYLSIEHRGDFEPGTVLPGVYGCDICQQVCPHNRYIPETTVEELRLRDSLRDLTVADLREMTQERFSAVFRKSAVKRAKLAGLQRNVAHLKKK